MAGLSENNNKLDKILDYILITVILLVLIIFVAIIIIGHSYPYNDFFDAVQGVGTTAKGLLTIS